MEKGASSGMTVFGPGTDMVAADDPSGFPVGRIPEDPDAPLDPIFDKDGVRAGMKVLVKCRPDGVFMEEVVTEGPDGTFWAQPDRSHIHPLKFYEGAGWFCTGNINLKGLKRLFLRKGRRG